MKILLNDNPTVTASALEKYILAADLNAQVNAVPAQGMLATVRDENPDIVMRYDENAGSAELTDFFRGVKAHNPNICRILITGSKNLQSVSEELNGLANEMLIYPFVTQELMMRLRRVFSSIAPAAEQPAAPQEILPVFIPAGDEPSADTASENTLLAEPSAAEPVAEQPDMDITQAGKPLSDAQNESGEEIPEPPAFPLNLTPDEITEFLPPDNGQAPAPAGEETDGRLPAQQTPAETHQAAAVEKPQPEAPAVKKTAWQKAASAVSKAVVAVVILLIAALAVLILTSRMNGGTPTIFGYRFYTVLTGSMSGKQPDSFNQGSLILVKPVNPDEIKPGDIITFDRKSEDSSLTTHRVKMVNRDADGKLSFTTQGDANAVQDSVPVPANIVKGKVVWHAQGVGKAVQFAQTGTGMIFFVFIPAGAIVAYEIFIFYQEHAQRKKKKKDSARM